MRLLARGLSSWKGKRIIGKQMDFSHDALRGLSDFMTNETSLQMGARDLHVDIFEKEKKIRVVVELPGVNDENIVLDLNEYILSISANGTNRSYYRCVELPRSCESIVGKICSNGILEVTLI